MGRIDTQPSESEQTMNQVATTLARFVARLGGMLLNRSSETPWAQPPAVDAVLRVGYVGHLDIGAMPHLQPVVRQVLACIAAVAREQHPAPLLHAVGQLAPGADTLVASQALALGYELHTILPGSRAHVVQDLNSSVDDMAHPDIDGSALFKKRTDEFVELLQRTSRVLELDASSADAAQGLQEVDYEQCAEVMLTRIDCLIALSHSAAGNRPGGTKWTERRARSFGIPVILIPIDLPGVVVLTNEDGLVEYEAAFDADEGRPWASAVYGLVTRIMATSAVRPFPFRTGIFERRYLAQLDIQQNVSYWDERWKSPSAVASPGLSDMRALIDDSIGRWAIWADHRASGMAELVRGTFVFCALLGLLAVSCALAALLTPEEVGNFAKIVEVICFLIVLWFIARDREMHWREQWLFCRQLERWLNHAAWLMLAGRELKHEPPAEIRAFHSSASATWMREFGRAVVRAAGLPQLKLDPTYLQAVRGLVLDRLIRDQAEYCRSEVALQRAADHLLERWIRRTFLVALVITVGYLILRAGFGLFSLLASGAQASWLVNLQIDWHRLSNAVSMIGIAMPCIAAALASIRSHGDFAQLATRYAGVGISLDEAERLLERVCPASEGDDASCTSRNIAAVIHHVVSLLGHEATSWSAIVQTKEIEP